MKAEAAKPDQQVAKKSDHEDSIMPMFDAVVQSSQSKIEKHDVGECVDDFGRIVGGIIILNHVSGRHGVPSYWSTILLHTN